MLEKEEGFCALVIASVVDEKEGGPGATYCQALELLEKPAKKAKAAGVGLQPDTALRALKRLLAPGELLTVEPAKIRMEDGVFTISKRARFQVRIGAIKDLLDPDNWRLLPGPLFHGGVAVAMPERNLVFRQPNVTCEDRFAELYLFELPAFMPGFNCAAPSGRYRRRSNRARSRQRSAPCR